MSQVPVNNGKNYNINSSVTSGQVPVRSSTEGNRGGDWTGRGCVSPLGNADLGQSNAGSAPEEQRERPQKDY